MKQRPPIIDRIITTRPIRAAGKHIVTALEAREKKDPNAARWHRPSGVWGIEGVPFFQLLPDVERAALKRHARIHDYSKRGAIFVPEDDAHVWIVLGGGVKLCRPSSGGRRFIEAILGPGDAFGRVTTTTSCAAFEIEALEPTRVVTFERARFEVLLRSHPPLAFAVVQDLETRQRKLVRRIEALVFKDVHTRVAETLLELASEHREPCSHGFAVDMRITQQDIAELVGASRQMVSRVLGDLERRLYVQRLGRVLCILHRERLERFAEGLA